MNERKDDGRAAAEKTPPAPEKLEDSAARSPTFAGLFQDTPTAPWLIEGRAGEKPVPLAPGLLLAERFRIVRFLGQGGMGDVYEAQDLEVGERVALKTLRPEIARDERAIERFRSELALARRVTHPNVCRIFDVFRHRPTDPADREMALISMEMLPGETLAERIHRGGPMPSAVALPLVKQMASALDAAHRAGVIHRDFKSSNVILVPPGVEGHPARAVVTDFGLAQGIAAGEESAAGESNPAEILGTPAYMAPEQVSGGAITPAADIYALGVVMYEMATGSCPFQADTPHITALKRLNEPVISPRVRVPGMDPRWEDVILRCLERVPTRRYPAAADLIAALEPPPPSTSSRRGLLAALAVLAALGGLAVFLSTGEKAPPRITANAQVTASAGLDLYPAFSPDGRSVAFASDRSGSFEIYTRVLDGPAGLESAITRDGEQNFQPAWSPDGRRIAYHSKGRGGLWIVAATGGEPARLSTFGSRPAWSPDGASLAFQSSPLVDFAANAVPASAPSTIWVAPVSGGEPRRITEVGAPAGAHGSPSWTPDSKRIVFGAYDRLLASIWSAPATGGEPAEIVKRQRYVFDPVCSPEGDAVYYAALLPGGSYGMWRAELSAQSGRGQGEPRALGSLGGGIARHPSVDHDGRRIVYSALTLVSNLWAAPLGGAGRGLAGPARALTTGTARANRPAFSPDGARIAFDRWQPGTNPDIWVMDRGGSGARPITTDGGVDTTASWTPEGDRIVFLSTRSGKAEARAVGADGSGETRQADLDQEVQFLKLSPDGKRLAFDAKGERGGTRIWIAAADGSGARPLTTEEDALAYPIWSPDGSRLAVQGRRGDDVDVVVVAVDGAAPRRLTSAAGQSWASAWSRDGRHVVFAALRDGFWSIRSVSAESGDERTLVSEPRLGAYLRYATISPQNDLLVYERAETTGNVWMIEMGR